MIASRLDGRYLRKGLFCMKPSALGLDRWNLADLRSLPDKLLGWMADPLQEGVRLGKWPSRLAGGYAALIPKEGPPGSLNTRPPTTLSVVYRLWAGPGRCHRVAGFLSPPGSLRLPPGHECPGRGSVDTSPPGTVPPPEVGRGGDEQSQVKCLDLIPRRPCWP